jgi:hypothetical protein
LKADEDGAGVQVFIQRFSTPDGDLTASSAAEAL